MIDNNVKSYLFLLLISLFMLGANPFKSETVAPMDLLVKYPGWQNANIHLDYINGERSDVLDAKLPIWISAKSDLYQGNLPIWNYQRGGKPGLTFTNSLLTPAFFAFAIVKNDALGFYLSNLINLLIGLLGMYLFLRIFLGQAASTFGAFIFMFSGFNAAWFFWAHVDTAVWTPWVLFTVYKYISTQEKRYLPFITLTMLMLNLGGFPMVAVMSYMSIAIMVFIFLISKRSNFMQWVRTFSSLALFSLLAVIIALPFIYPLVELIEWMGGIGYRHGGSGFSLAAFELFINPNFYRIPKVETTFYVGVLPVVFLFISFILYFLKPRFIAIFGIILFLYSTTIAFTLISPEIIHKIPTLNSSLLTRFGFLIGLSLAIVAAYVFHVIIEKFDNSKWLYLIIAIIFSVQVFDQKKLFNAFNAPVPNASFYPQTKSISYLQENLKPFQYLIADGGFLIAGILGGYRLNDWYAHSFHSIEEKKILNELVNKPFKTPTSSTFAFSQINLDSPYVDYLGIKYMLSTSLSIEDSIPLWNNERAQAPSPTLSTDPFIQNFHMNEDKQVYGLSLLMATYGAKHASSDIELILTREGNEIATSVVDKEMVMDNNWVPFKFGKFMHLKKGNYSVSIRMLSDINIKPLAIWTNIDETQYKLVANGEEHDLSLKIGWSKKRIFNEKYKILNLEPNIHIIENLHIQGGAYFLKTLDTIHNVEYSDTETTLVSNTEIEIQYSNDKDGWVILPMRSYPGWQATVNGKDIEIQKFLGMLPAIKVNGKSNIHMKYAPTYNKYTYAFSLLSLFILLFSILKFRRKD